MGLEGISKTIHIDTTNTAQQSKTDLSNTHDSGTLNIDIKEVPDIIKTSSSKQEDNEQENGKNEKTVSEKQIKDAISKANSILKVRNTRVEFSFYKETNRVCITVIDKDTDEVIKEIPPEKALEMVEKMWELAGMLVDEKR